jgi:8-oxo-dGTP pyrophosphatase MutT (NUDIX family)
MHAAWPAIDEARHRRVARVPFAIDGRVVGSVARAHLHALEAWPRWIALRNDGAELKAPPAERDAALAEMNAALHAEGLIVAWRDEPFPLLAPDGRAVLATFERAAARFWGTLTLGAHCNGYVAGAGGQPQRLWIARRADTKATDPGKHDNLVGGGVPLGQTPLQALVREGFEEAGLAPRQMAGLAAGRVIRLDRDVPEGRQVEHIHVFDLALPDGLVPCNQDGEVAAIEALPIAQALALAAGRTMTTDAALVTLDFALRHRLLDAGTHAALEVRAAGLWAEPGNAS